MRQMAEKDGYSYRPHGVCSRMINFDIDEDGKVHDVQFFGGCNGNAKGIGSLVEDMPAEWVIDRVKGTRCGGKMTSCPDQLARALEAALASEKQ